MHHPFTLLNRQIAEAEKSHDDKALASLLAPDLKFRRASGAVVGAAEFLNQLPGITYEYNQPDDGIRVTCLDEHIFMVEVQVKAKGVGGKGPFEGAYYNVRFFRKEQDEWKLYAWHNHDLKTDFPKEAKFTGSVWWQVLEPISGQTHSKCRSVFFEPGARTYWHLHTEPQELLISAGKAEVGILINGKEERRILHAGERVTIPPGVMHWHGAQGEHFMVHLAVNYTRMGEPGTYWFEEVKI